MVMCKSQGGAARDLHRSEELHSFNGKVRKPQKIVTRYTKLHSRDPELITRSKNILCALEWQT